MLELLIVVGIIGLLLVLIAPAFTTIKGGTDVTSAAYTIQGVLDTARTYAKANNTYTWVGFFAEFVLELNAPTGAEFMMAIVASKDGTDAYTEAPTMLYLDGCQTKQCDSGRQDDNARQCSSIGDYGRTAKRLANVNSTESR